MACPYESAEMHALGLTCATGSAIDLTSRKTRIARGKLHVDRGQFGGLTGAA
jgi:hypothetical protein